MPITGKPSAHVHSSHSVSASGLHVVRRRVSRCSSTRREDDDAVDLVDLAQLALVHDAAVPRQRVDDAVPPQRVLLVHADELGVGRVQEHRHVRRDPRPENAVPRDDDGVVTLLFHECEIGTFAPVAMPEKISRSG